MTNPATFLNWKPSNVEDRGVLEARLGRLSRKDRAAVLAAWDEWHRAWALAKADLAHRDRELRDAKRVLKDKQRHARALEDQLLPQLGVRP